MARRNSDNFLDEEFEEPEGNSRRRHTLIGPGSGLKVMNQLSSLVQHRAERAEKKKQKQQPAIDYEALKERRENLIETILIQEDNIMDSHKQFIDDMIGCVKDDSDTYQCLQKESSVSLQKTSSLQTICSRSERF